MDTQDLRLIVKVGVYTVVISTGTLLSALVAGLAIRTFLWAVGGL